MEKKLFVGGLPYATTEDALTDLFVQAGAVESVKIITDRETGRSRGFAFVEMESEDGAQKAIEMFDGKEFEGRNLIVNEAKPMTDRPKRNNFRRENRF